MKTYFQIEDFDSELWNRLNQEYPDYFGSLVLDPEHDLVTLESEDYNLFMGSSPGQIWSHINMYSLSDGCEKYDSQYPDSCESQSFISTLPESCIGYIMANHSKYEQAQNSTLLYELGPDNLMNLLYGALGSQGFSRIFGINKDSSFMSEAEEAFDNGSLEDFNHIVTDNIDYEAVESRGHLGIEQILAFVPQALSFLKNGLIQEDLKKDVMNIIEKHAEEYEKWLQQPYYERYGLLMPLLADYCRGKMSLEFVFFLKYFFFNDDEVLDRMFLAMNSEDRDSRMNMELVKAVSNYPDPEFAKKVDERYKEFKKYNGGGLDFVFFDPNRKERMPLPTNDEEIDPVLEVVSGLIKEPRKALPEDYHLKKWIFEGEQDKSCLKLKGKIIEKKDRRFCILLNAMAKLGYVEDTKENLQRMAIALSGFGGKKTEDKVKLLNKQKEGDASRAIWYLVSKIVLGSESEGKRKRGVKYGSKYDKAKGLFYFEDPKEQENFMKKSRNPGRAKEDIKCLLKIIYDIKPSPKKKKIRSK